MLDAAAVWDALTITDDFIFAKVMLDKTLCQLMLEKLLGMKIDHIDYLEEQKTINIDYNARSVRLDVYLENETEAFNVEMQTTNEHNLAMRSRYYQGMIDLNTIEKGQTYSHLKKSYIIFLCTFDPFGLQLPQYWFENMCREEHNLKLDDGTYKIFFNATAYAKCQDKDIRDFLRYICEGQLGESQLVEQIDERFREVKLNRTWRREYMSFYTRELELAEASERKGRQEGRQEQQEKNIRSMLKKLDAKSVAELLEIDLAVVKRVESGESL